MPSLYKPEAIFSWRHAPSWVLLAAAAGLTNGVAFMANERFVTHVTGTATQLGLASLKVWLALDFAVVLGCFVLGAAAAAAVLDVRAERGRRPLYAVPLFVTSTVLAGVAVVGRLGAFGAFGGTVDRPADFVVLSLLSFAMGLQNGAVATSTGMVVRTTHLTGPATDLGLHLAQFAATTGERRGTALRNAALRASKVVAFVAGAAVAVPLARAFGYGALLVPAAQVALANVLSFVDSREARDGRAGPNASGAGRPERVGSA